MLRELQVIQGKPADATFKAGVPLITGMVVGKEEGTKEAKFPSVQYANDMYFVDKERVATGTGAAKLYASDYDDDFTKIQKGEFVKLIAYTVGEIFATDQVVFTGLKVGDRLAAGTEGKLVKATTAKSKYIFIGEFIEGKNKLAMVKVSDGENTSA